MARQYVNPMLVPRAHVALEAAGHSVRCYWEGGRPRYDIEGLAEGVSYPEMIELGDKAMRAAAGKQ